MASETIDAGRVPHPPEMLLPIALAEYVRLAAVPAATDLDEMLPRAGRGVDRVDRTLADHATTSPSRSSRRGRALIDTIGVQDGPA